MKKNSTEITYVGIDAHKKEHVFHILYPGEEKGTGIRIRNNDREIKRLVKKIQAKSPGEVRMCYEAGPLGFVLQRQVERKGVSCVVIAPSLMPVKPGERIKTDRRDARKLAEYFKSGLLTDIAPPTPHEEAVRDLCRCRSAAKKAETRARHQLSKFLLRRGFNFLEGKQWTLKHRSWLKSLEFADPLDGEVFEELLSEVDHAEQRVKRLDGKLERAAKEEPYATAVGWLRCFRGFDTLTALSVAAELYGFERFDSARALMGYLGLTPSEESSGETRRMGGITKTGNRRVRRLLVEAAKHQRNRPTVSAVLKRRRENQPDWVIREAEKAKTRLHHKYWRLMQKGKPANVAAVAVARELAGFIWSVLHTQVELAPEGNGAPRPMDGAGVVDKKRLLPTAPWTTAAERRVGCPHHPQAK